MAFAISMAVRRGDAALRDRINAALDREQPMVDAILRSYGVPLSASRLSPIIPKVESALHEEPFGAE